MIPLSRALLLLLVSCATAWADGPRRFGLFVGSNGAPPGREALRHAEADALRMRGVFLDVGQMSERDALLLLSPSADQLLAGLKALATRAADHPEALVVFYYSGHADERALLLGEGELRMDALRQALDALPGRLALHIVDACRSGALVRPKGARRGPKIEVKVAPKTAGRAVIASSAAFEDSQESDRLGGSFFTLHLASGMRGAADVDADGQVTLAEAYDYVYARTVESTRATTAGAQHPTYRYDLRGRGETVLTWTRGAEARTAWLGLGEGDYLVLDGANGRVVAEVVARGAGEALALRPASYRVSRRDPDALFEGRVTLAPGETVAADGHLTRRVEYARLVRKGGRSVSTTVWFEGGVRGPLDDGIGAAPLGRLAVSVHLPWFTLRPRASFARTLDGGAQETPRLTFDLTEISAGVEVRREFDFAWATLSGGLVAESIWLIQTEREQREAERSSAGFAFGLVASVESRPPGPVSLMLSGEVDALNYPVIEADRAPTGDPSLSTVLTYRTTLGVGYAF